MTGIAMGSDAPTKNEVAPAALAAADGYSCDRLSQVRLVGELHHAIEAGTIDAAATFPELGEVVAGQRPGRTHAPQGRSWDHTGTGGQDPHNAERPVGRAQAAGGGAGAWLLRPATKRKGW